MDLYYSYVDHGFSILIARLRSGIHIRRAAGSVCARSSKINSLLRVLGKWW